jgi:hypothetical protein
MQFQVPQNIAIEDKIVGPLTAIQFGIVLVGGGFSFWLYSATWIPKPVNTIIGITGGLITAIMALGKFNDQPMYRFVKFIFAFAGSPKIRIWKKSGPEVKLVREHVETTEEKPVFGQKRVSKRDLARLAQVLDSRGQTGTVPTALQREQPSKGRK